MEIKEHLSRELFLECDWKYNSSVATPYSYVSIMFSLKAQSDVMRDLGREDCANVLDLLAKITSMRLQAESLNEPFKPYFENFQVGQRSLGLNDIFNGQLNFFEEIINDVTEPYLKARLADLLWLCKTPRNHEYAKIAIDSYISAKIDDISWYGGVNEYMERAIRLSIQINDKNRIKNITDKLMESCLFDYPESKYMRFHIAKLVSDTNIDKEYRDKIAPLLFDTGYRFKKNNDYFAAENYFDLALKKYEQLGNNEKKVECQVNIANCLELTGGLRESENNLAANSFYRNALQAYRKVPRKYRVKYFIDKKISELMTKIRSTGQDSIEEMCFFEVNNEDYSELIQNSKDYVKNKNINDAILKFIKLYPGPNYENIFELAKASLQESGMENIFGECQMSIEGRLTAKIPPMNPVDHLDPQNEVAVYSRMHKLFNNQVGFIVENIILPALIQLQKEHRFTKDLMFAICHQSPLVSEDREYLLGFALWLGFEGDFGAAIHLICPQIEHMVRVQLKDNNAHTTNINLEDIENENGLSTLMGLPKTEQIFGRSLVLEMKNIFTESKGFNLRNMVAHGLLDNNSSRSVGSVYAWWLTLRLLITSIINGNIKRD